MRDELRREHEHEGEHRIQQLADHHVAAAVHLEHAAHVARGLQAAHARQEGLHHRLAQDMHELAHHRGDGEGGEAGSENRRRRDPLVGFAAQAVERGVQAERRRVAELLGEAGRSNHGRPRPWRRRT